MLKLTHLYRVHACLPEIKQRGVNALNKDEIKRINEKAPIFLSEREIPYEMQRLKNYLSQVNLNSARK